MKCLNFTRIEFCEFPGGSNSGNVIVIGCPARDNISAWWFVTPAVSTALTMGIQQWIVFGGCTFPGCSVVGQEALVDGHKAALRSLNFLLCSLHVCVTEILVSLKTQKKQ